MNNNPTTTTNSSGSLNLVEQHVLSTIDLLQQMKTTVQKYSHQSEAHWQNSVSRLMEEFRILHNETLPSQHTPINEDDHNIHQLYLPDELVGKIDQGTSPDSFLDDVKLEAKKQSELALGKNTVFKTLRDVIEREASSAFPEEFQEYSTSLTSIVDEPESRLQQLKELQQKIHSSSAMGQVKEEQNE